MQENGKIAVTVITGFLGAGKTTFINYLLKINSEVQFALVENEFGDVSIDTQLIKGVDASQMFELKEGCICCTITDEYELVLQELAGRFPHVRHLLIETTGVAEPASVIRPFLRDENLQEIYRYNGTVCLVDAIHFDSQPELEIALKQLAVADVALISKSEDFSPEQKGNWTKKITELNPLAEVTFVYQDYSVEFDLNQITRKSTSLPESPNENHAHSALTTKKISYESALDKEEFSRQLSYFLDVHKNEIFRVKGILQFKNEPFKYILQGIGGSFELSESESFVQPNTRSEIVFIGKNIPPF